jgi:hypothetical protein
LTNGTDALHKVSGWENRSKLVQINGGSEATISTGTKIVFK